MDEPRLIALPPAPDAVELRHLRAFLEAVAQVGAFVRDTGDRAGEVRTA